MPHSWTKPTADEQQRVNDGDANHYFDSAHGDVAALHARIEQGYTGYSIAAPPISPLGAQADPLVQSVSHYAGIVGLVATLAGITYWLA